MSTSSKPKVNEPRSYNPPVRGNTSRSQPNRSTTAKLNQADVERGPQGKPAFPKPHKSSVQQQQQQYQASNDMPVASAAIATSSPNGQHVQPKNLYKGNPPNPSAIATLAQGGIERNAQGKPAFPKPHNGRVQQQYWSGRDTPLSCTATANLPQSGQQKKRKNSYKADMPNKSATVTMGQNRVCKVSQRKPATFPKMPKDRVQDKQQHNQAFPDTSIASRNTSSTLQNRQEKKPKSIYKGNQPNQSAAATLHKAVTDRGLHYTPAFPKMRKNSVKQQHNQVALDTSISSGATSITLQNGHNEEAKNDKPFFMDYLTEDAATRELNNNEFIQGVLRINQRNLEEAYIDNPMGDDQQGILISGMRDRNRALHGDVVVVRLKDRSQWVVRNAVYQEWRREQGDGDDQPAAIPTVVDDEGNCNDEHDLVDAAPEATPTTNQNKPDEALQLQAPVKRRHRRRLRSSKKQINAGEQTQCTGTDADATPNRAFSSTSSEKSEPTKKIGKDGQPHNEVDSDGTKARPATTGTDDANPTSVLLPNEERVADSTAKPKGAKKRQRYRALADFSNENCEMLDTNLHKTAEVVYIAEVKGSRTTTGQLKPMEDGRRNMALFHPSDGRMPRMKIPSDQLPDGFFERPQDFSKYIFVARISKWPVISRFAQGKLQRQLGLVGDIEAETEGMLITNEVDTREFSKAALRCLPISSAKEWKIDKKEFEYRRDFRKEVVFTIDPLTARDLDDALHIKRIKNCDGQGTPGWEVGVHIADVSYFVRMNTELDNWARQRATSVYLVHKVIPMLPRILCEQLCSLNPGVERLTFSVVWKMNDEAEIKDTWFGRSVINSCTKLAYEHAQDVIHHPEKNFREEEFPERTPNVSMQQINTSIHNLQHIAKKLKAKRIANGSLRLDSPKLKFSLDPETGMPIGITVGERKDANYLVEEFMLLANMSVAQRIEQAYPQIAVLRRRPPPKEKVLREVIERCEKLELHLDGKSSRSLAESLDRYANHPEKKMTVFPVLAHLLMKAMHRAVYFCTGKVKSETDYHHYGLSVPYYTHFTSPIRRYPDLMVHRLLAATLGYAPPPEHTPDEVEKIAKHCNDRKVAAKQVSEASDDMFFGLFVKESGTFETVGVVVAVMDGAVDVLLVKYGIIKRIYANKLKLARKPRMEKEGPLSVIVLYWNLSVFGEDDDGENECQSTPNGRAVNTSNNSVTPTSKRAQAESNGTTDTTANSMVEQRITVMSVLKLALKPSSLPTKYNATIIPTADNAPLQLKDVEEFFEEQSS
ncbi:RNB-like protein [Aphelenchoides avenae]|nr:RNB-like protein [Aphelenchus avenae]